MKHYVKNSFVKFSYYSFNKLRVCLCTCYRVPFMPPSEHCFWTYIVIYMIVTRKTCSWVRCYWFNRIFKFAIPAQCSIYAIRKVVFEIINVFTLKTWLIDYKSCLKYWFDLVNIYTFVSLRNNCIHCAIVISLQLIF